MSPRPSSTPAAVHRLALALAFSFALTAASTTARAAEPYLPASDDQVLVRLPEGTGNLRNRPNLAASERPLLDQVRHLADLARHEGDPRYLSRALALLQPVAATNRSNADFQVVHAGVLQGLHDFHPALALLDQALRANPRHAGAWQMKAALHQVLGDYDSARAAVLQLMRWGDELNAATAAAALTGLTDGSVDTGTTLASVILRSPTAPANVRAWGWTTAGEIQALHGDLDGAEASFRTALQLEPGSPYTLAALADLLLDSGRAQQAVELLGVPTIDGLRIRLAEALLRLRPDASETRQLIAQIEEGMRLSRLRGDALHLREQARFTLRVRHEPTVALRLAQQNWSIQKEPADLLLLLECARSAGDPGAMAEAESWARRHQPATLRRHQALAAIDRGALRTNL